LGEEDRLIIAEDDVAKKESPDGLPPDAVKSGKAKQRKKQNRFNGLTEEELSKRLLPDSITPNLDILIVSYSRSYSLSYMHLTVTVLLTVTHSLSYITRTFTDKVTFTSYM
jgi:hypothetical protein